MHGTWWKKKVAALGLLLFFFINSLHCGRTVTACVSSSYGATSPLYKYETKKEPVIIAFLQLSVCSTFLGVKIFYQASWPPVPSGRGSHTREMVAGNHKLSVCGFKAESWSWGRSCFSGVGMVKALWWSTCCLVLWHWQVQAHRHGRRVENAYRPKV